MVPVNIALHHGASMQVMDLLIRAAPEMLLAQDGPKKDTFTLQLALRTRPKDTDLLVKIVNAQPWVAQTKDSRGNYPLHMACTKSVSVAVVFASLWCDWKLLSVGKGWFGSPGEGMSGSGVDVVNLYLGASVMSLDEEMECTP